MRRLYPYFGKYKKFLGFGFIAVLFDVLCEVSIPLLIGMIIDNGIQKGDMNYIVKIGLLMLLVSIIALATGGSNAYFSSKSAQGMGANLRNALFAKIQEFSFANVDQFSTSSLVTRCTNDVNTIQMAVMMSLRLLIRAPLMLIMSVIMSIRINLELTLILLVAIPILLVSVLVIFRAVNPLFRKAQQKLDALSRTVQENVVGQRVVKAFVRKNYEEEKFAKANKDVVDTNIKAVSIMSVALPIMMIVMNGAVIAALWFGGSKVADGVIQVGNLNTFINYAMQILISFLMVAMMLIMIGRARASYDRVFEVLDVVPSVEDPKQINDCMVTKGEVRFDQVSFHYGQDGSSEGALQGVNFTANPGEVIAIIGATGAGKSTLVNLIPRLYDTTEGKVLIDGRDVRDYEQKHLRENIGVVLQKNVLFTGTIRDNIRWGKEDATDEEIIQACKAAQAHDFIMDFPDGYDTHIEQGGTNVSGGQRQRLCIARALVKQPKILILDDSTSAVDTATEAKIREAFYHELKDSTIFLVAQRVSSVREADQIIVLNDGEVTGMGTHEELIRDNQFYREIVRSQNEEVA